MLKSFVDDAGKATLLDRGDWEIENTAVKLKLSSAFSSISEERLYTVAEMRVAFENELEKSGLDSHVYQDQLAEFDDHFSKPENLDAYLVARKEAFAKEVSYAAAKTIAGAKGSFVHVETGIDDRGYVGRVMDVTTHHAVLSLGRNAVIIDLSLLNSPPSKEQDVSIVFKDGRGYVSCEEHGHSLLHR